MSVISAHKKQLNIKQGETAILGSACHRASLYITILKWTTLGQGTGICVGKTKLCYTQICDCTKIFDLSFVLSNLLNRLSSEYTVRLQLLVSGKLQWHSGNHSSSLKRRYIEICIIFCFLYICWWLRLERKLLGKCYIVLYVKTCETNMNELQDLKITRLNYFVIYIYIYTHIYVYK